jgi:tRNA pseudouridine55 synthase
LQRTEALGFKLEQSVSWEQLEAVPPPALVDPLEALSHLQQHQLTTEALAGWRCGRLQACEPTWPIDAPVVVVGLDGNLAGMARVQASGQLQPRLVLDAAG